MADGLAMDRHARACVVTTRFLTPGGATSQPLHTTTDIVATTLVVTCRQAKSLGFSAQYAKQTTTLVVVASIFRQSPVKILLFYFNKISLFLVNGMRRAIDSG
jgi:hypothetical protein